MNSNRTSIKRSQTFRRLGRGSLDSLPELKKRERPFESQVRDALKKWGVLFVKLKPTVTGFPDRLAIFDSQMRLVELKRSPDDRLSPEQILRHAELRDHGIEVLVVYGPSVLIATDIIRRALR